MNYTRRFAFCKNHWTALNKYLVLILFISKPFFSQSQDYLLQQCFVNVRSRRRHLSDASPNTEKLTVNHRAIMLLYKRAHTEIKKVFLR